MQVTKHGNGTYTTEDGQVFRRLGDAYGHVRRLAVASYLKVLRNNIMRETGPLTADELKKVTKRQRSGAQFTDGLDELANWTDDIAEILEESPALLYAPDVATSYRQRPLREAA